MKQDLSEIVCIIDRSGSMDLMKSEAIGGFNAFLADQKKVPGKARLTLILFDHEYILVHDGVPLDEVSRLIMNPISPADGLLFEMRSAVRLIP